MFDRCELHARDALEMQNIGASLAYSWYRYPGTLLLRGDLGAGKTTFVQGLARGLGIRGRITSPTYALEQRYGKNVLSHIDLYRLGDDRITEFLDNLDPFPGIRVIEWSERAMHLHGDSEVTIDESVERRSIIIDCHDILIPTKKQMNGWMRDTCLPNHIVKHCEVVASVCDDIAKALLGQGRMIRPKALHAAGLVHDLLRFVDFLSLEGNEHYSPSKSETERWSELKEKYGSPHETAAERFLVDQGYPDLGTIVRTHRGHGSHPMDLPQTIEQMALCYADKRVRFTERVTVDERFDDFMKRYGGGKESERTNEWKKEIKRIEKILFPDEVPF